MIKKKRKIKVPAAAKGLDTSKLIEAAPQLIELLSNPFRQSTATSGGEATVQSIGNVGKGAAAGFSVAGPVGAAVGAGIGMIGNKGRSAGMQGFTEYDEGTLGTGLIGAFSNKKLRRQRNSVKQNAYNNIAGVQGTNYLANEYGADYGDLDMNSFEQGGSVPQSLAYVDDGELIQTPNGQVNQVPEQGQPIDSNLVSLPEGSRILSNTLKVPGTKKTFSELGKEMMTNKKSKGNDRFAQGAAKLNEMNNKIIHDQLFTIQESIKQSKGVKPKTKDLEAFEGGGTKRWRLNKGYRKQMPNGMTPLLVEEAGPEIINHPAPIGPKQFETLNANLFAPQNSPKDTVQPSTTNPRRKPLGLAKPLDYIDSDHSVEPTLTTSSIPLADPLDYVDEDYTLDPTTDDIKSPKGNNKNRFSANLNGLLGGISSLVPIMSNLFAKDERPVNPNYNPYASAITNTMRRRRFNIDPAIEDITRNRAMANYNAGQMNTNTGANLAFRLQSAVNSDRAISNLRAQESNMNNQYAGEYANTMNNLGQQWVGATNMAQEQNAQNRATGRNIRRAGLSQLSQWGQNREMMNNQRNRDNAMMQLYTPFLQAGFTNADMSNLMKYLRKGGNSVG